MPTYLPSKDSEEAQEICNLYPTASREKMNEWRVKYGYKTVISLREAIRTQYQIFRQRNIPELEAEEIRKEALVINLPPVKVNLYKGGRQKKGDEEEMVVIDSDGHAGKLTNSYNKEIYRKRMETKFNSIVTIVNLHRKMYPIKKLHILALGDHIQGENVHQGSKLEEVEMGARNQLIKIAVPIWNDYLASLRQHFTEIIIDGFPGNHGAYDRLAPATSNWDFLLYDILEQGICQKVKNLTMNIHDDPSGMGIVNIMGFRMLCFHGDAVRSTQGVPYFALQRRIKEWYMQFGGFSYAFCAHFHKLAYDEIGAGVEMYMNSTLVSDDPWALKKLGVSSRPRQWALGFHPRMGISWAYRLIVDKAEFQKVVRGEKSNE